MKDNSYSAVMSRKNEIMKRAIGIDYAIFENEGLGFDYERMMRETGYTLEEMQEIQGRTDRRPLRRMHPGETA